jgi:hypothetical protein
MAMGAFESWRLNRGTLSAGRDINVKAARRTGVGGAVERLPFSAAFSQVQRPFNLLISSKYGHLLQPPTLLNWLPTPRWKPFVKEDGASERRN